MTFAVLLDLVPRACGLLPVESSELFFPPTAVTECFSFSDVECEYGISGRPDLQGLERHERCGWTPEHSDILIFGAEKGSGASEEASWSSVHSASGWGEVFAMLGWKIDTR